MADLAHAAENDTDLHGDRDAMHWAQRFASRFEVRRLSDIGNRGIVEPLDTMGLMLAWFASAIETGRMAGGAELAKAPSDEDRIRDAMAEAQDHPGRIITR